MLQNQTFIILENIYLCTLDKEEENIILLKQKMIIVIKLLGNVDLIKICPITHFSGSL